MDYECKYVTKLSLSEHGGDLLEKGDTIIYENKKYLVFQVLGSHAILKGIEDKTDAFIIKFDSESIEIIKHYISK